MSVHRYHTSWGRTRRPKQLSHEVPPSKQAATSVTPVAAGSLADDLDSATAANNGYVTENQRFLHIQIENDDTDDTLEVYAYNYAFGAWAKLYLPHGISLNGSGADTSVVNDAYVEAKWTTINGKFMVTIPIHGIDRIAFVHDGSLADMVVRAACSTF